MRHLLRAALCGLLYLSITSSGYAQKPDKESWGYINYIQPSASDALAEKEFFLLLFELSESNDAYRRKMFEDQMEFVKYKPVGTAEEPSFIVKVIESPLKYSTGKRKSYSERYKENGQEKTRQKYYYEGDVGYFYTLKVLDMEENELFRDVVKGFEKMRGSYSETITGAHDNYVRSKVNGREQVVKKVAPRLATIFNEQFADVEKTTHIIAIRIKGKKHNYDVFNEAYADLERVYNILSAGTEPTEESKEKLQSAIEAFKGLLEQATPEDEKSKMNADVTAAAHYNLGLAYFFARDFGPCAEHFVQAGSYNKKVAPGIKFWVATSKDLAERASK